VRAFVDLRLALSIACGILVAATGLALGWFLFVLRDVLVPYVAVLVAETIARPVGWLERHRLPAGVAVSLVFAAAGLIAVALVLLVLPPLVAQALALRDELPRLVEQLVRLRALWRELRASYPELAPVELHLEAMTSQWLASFARQSVLLPRWALATILDLVAIIALSSALVMQRRTLFALLLAAMPPAQRPLLRAIVVEIWRRIGNDVSAKLTVMGIVGVGTALVLWPLGVPSPLLLGLLVAVGELVPGIGP
jgi:predicted PurR-regulated permease PerM